MNIHSIHKSFCYKIQQNQSTLLPGDSLYTFLVLEAWLGITNYPFLGFRLSYEAYSYISLLPN